MAQRRVSREIEKSFAFNELHSDKQYVITPIERINGDLLSCKCTMIGPLGSPYHGGLYNLHIRFPADYPFKPPKITFSTKIFHQKISGNGDIHLGILSTQAWTPRYTCLDVICAIFELLARRVSDDCCTINMDAAKLYKSDLRKFWQTAVQYNQRHADGFNVDYDECDVYNFPLLSVLQLTEIYNALHTYLPEALNGDHHLGNIIIAFFGKKDEELKYCTDYVNEMRIQERKKLQHLNVDQSGPKIQIDVQTMTGKNVEMEMSENDFVYRLKCKYMEHEGVAIEQQRLIFQGKQLLDDKRLKDYGIGEKNIAIQHGRWILIHCVYRLMCSGG